MIEILLAIIAIELGIVVASQSLRLFTETSLIRAAMKLKQATNSIPPGFRELTDSEIRAMGIDPAKLQGEIPKKPGIGQYV